jgi:outer membrane protein
MNTTMKFLRIYLLPVICLTTTMVATAQQKAPLLTLKEAVEIALKNNYNIKLSANNNTIAKNNVTLGNAGILPQVSLDATLANSIQTTKQTRTDGTVTEINGAHNSNLSYGPSLNWTIFDGFAMFANLDQLKGLSRLSELSQRDTIESTISNVISTYYNLVNQDQQIKALEGAIEISRTQLRYANDKLQVGRGSGLDVLNARVNVNTDTASLITQIQQYRSTKVSLNQLLVRDLQTDFTVIDTIVIDEKLLLGNILSQAQTQNPSILISQINRELADINLRQVKALRYPTVGLTGGYTISNNKTPANLVTRQQDIRGFNYGVTASFNIFNGFNQSRIERNAQIEIENSALNLSRTKQNIEARINTFYISYLSGLEQVKLNQSNVDIAKRNLDISLEKYKLGNITPLEIREAQRNYLDAQSRYFQSQYQAKSAEVTLKEITNSINIQ